MTEAPDDGAEVIREIIAATDPVLLVVGGAGTGKTTTAAAAVRAELVRGDELEVSSPSGNRRPSRALFLSFSRAAVAQTLVRSKDILGAYEDRVEITTYHAFAWDLLQKFGNSVGLLDPELTSPAEAKILPSHNRILYDDLIPFALRICSIPAIAAHLQSRWSIIVCDEFQDTTISQFRLLEMIRGQARLLLLGDLNQCIYEAMPGMVGVGQPRLADALQLDGARQINMAALSHRDPTGVLPAAADAIRRRDFTDPAIATALSSGRLRIEAGLDPELEADSVASHVQCLLGEGNETVAVFSHHVDSTTDLSDRLRERGVEHEIIGLSDCLTAALQAQYAMISFSLGKAEWEYVLQRLAVFVTSSVRGKTAPMLAYHLLKPDSPSVSSILRTRLDSLRRQLLESDARDAVNVGISAHGAIGLTRGARHWRQASQMLAPLVAQAMRRERDTLAALDLLERTVAERRTGLLTNLADGDEIPVQLMGLYQAKGREAEATVVVLRESDYFGNEYYPYPNGSRLLYVDLTRARKTTVLLLFGTPRQLVSPLAELGEFAKDA